MYKILSCDGGGIRGLLTALLLESLEAELQQLDSTATLAKCFDMFAGTSTGSIIACGLAKGMSTKTIRQFYKLEGEKIFPTMDADFWTKQALNRIRKGDASLPLFDDKDLEAVLTSAEIFPPTLLFGDLPKPTLITSYDTYNREAVVFKNTRQKFATIPVWQICRSSSAAPVAFAGYLLQDEQFLKAIKEQAPNFEGDLLTKIPPEGIPLIDGGVVANNPALCAIAEQIAEEGSRGLNDIFVAAFGTGQLPRRITPNEVTTWGGWDWVYLFKGIPLLDVFSDGSADAIDYISGKLLRDNYLRYQPVLEPETSTFQADPKNLELLRKAAKNYLDTGGRERLQQLAKKLLEI
jgi:patatin-like phospholipase/acyl hydrolase